MPELPEVEAWRRQLDPLVKRSPIEQAGPAHIATLKTFDPPLAALDGEGPARRRAAREAVPAADRRRRARAARAPDERRPAQVRPVGRQRREVADFQAHVRRRRRAAADRGGLEEARRRLAAAARGRAGRARPPRPGGRPALRRGRRADPRVRLAAAPLAAPRPAPDRRDRPRVGERDPLGGAAVAVRALDAGRRRGDGATRLRDLVGDGARARAAPRPARTTRRPTASTTSSTGRASATARRSRASTSRSTRSTTARPARPRAACSRTGGMSRLLK